MKAIVQYTKEEYVEMKAKRDALHSLLADVPRSELIKCNKQYGYAHYRFDGYYTDKLVELLGRQPTEDEIILLVDGFSHFGANCTISIPSQTFRGRVNID